MKLHHTHQSHHLDGSPRYSVARLGKRTRAALVSRMVALMSIHDDLLPISTQPDRSQIPSSRPPGLPAFFVPQECKPMEEIDTYSLWVVQHFVRATSSLAHGHPVPISSTTRRAQGDAHANAAFVFGDNPLVSALMHVIRNLGRPIPPRSSVQCSRPMQ